MVIKLLIQKGGDIIQDKIILLIVGFKSWISITVAFGKSIGLNGGIFVKIQKKFWIWMLIYTIIIWCLAFYIMWIVYN